VVSPRDTDPGPGGAVRVVPLAFMVVSHVGFALRQAINSAIKEQRLPAIPKDVDRDLADRLMGLNTKVASLPIIIERLQRNWEAVRQHAMVRDRSLDGYALDGKREESREMVIDTESLFTTLKSAYDVAQRLAKCVGRRVLNLPNVSIEAALARVAGLPETQRKLLEYVRGEFVHASAPWFEVLIPEQGSPDLVILLSHDPDYRRGEGYILLSTVNGLVTAVATYLDALEGQLVAMVNEYGLDSLPTNAHTH